MKMLRSLTSLTIVVAFAALSGAPAFALDCVNQVPFMTSNTSPSGTVTTSGIFSASFDAWQAFDASDTSMWISEVGETPAWIAYDFGSPRNIDQYSLTFVNGSLTSRAPKDWTFEGWNSSSWVILDTRTGETNWAGTETRTYSVASPGNYAKYRLNITDDNDVRSGVVVISFGRVSFESCVTPGPNDVCPAGSQVVDLRTGLDVDSNGQDDNWTVMDPGAVTSDPATVFDPAFAAWRGAVQTLGPFNTGSRYPVLGDGRWITNDVTVGDAVYELKFTLDGSCPWPVLALEVNADNFVELELNGNVIFSSTGTPPAPWLSNQTGIYHPDADPDDGLLHPTCDAPGFRCTNTEDNWREIHPVIVDGPAFLDIDGENTLTARVLDEGVITGFLVTGGAETSILSGATVRCCVPDRPQAAVAAIFTDGFESGDTSAWSSQQP